MRAASRRALRAEVYGNAAAKKIGRKHSSNCIFYLSFFRRYLIVLPRPLLAVPLAVYRTYLMWCQGLLPAATRRCRSKRKALGRCTEEHSQYYQLYLRRGKVPLGAMCLRRVVDMALACRRGDWWCALRFLKQPEHRNEMPTRSRPFRILNLHQKNLAGD
jgi:hypothetical protein